MLLSILGDLHSNTLSGRVHAGTLAGDGVKNYSGNQSQNCYLLDCLVNFGLVAGRFRVRIIYQNMI